ncbi:MAG: FtsW/RodA/SpoVE family cell cycle protein [Clostridiales bacterium]|nr:FtsW/RodA/SpoVE family cell cycle protein [Clostridiales bacterium]
MSRMKKKSTAISLERFRWELMRAFYSFKNSPVFALLLFQIAVFVVVHAKGAGAIYRDMIVILCLITLISWFFTSVIHGNQKILIYSLILLTVGTMLQCILIEEELLSNADATGTGNPAAELQIQYLVAFLAAMAGAVFYLKCKEISCMWACRILTVLSLGISVMTLLLAKSVGNVRNWIMIGSTSLQTTEIVKVLYVFICAALLGTTENPSRQRIRVFYGFTVMELLFLAIQSEFGTLLLILMLFLTFAFLFIPDLRVFIKTVVVMAILAACIVLVGMQLTKLAEADSVLGTNALSQLFLSNYEKIANRVIYWLHPENDALGLGYQLLKAKESIVLGGWFGTSSLTDLPVKTSDLVYPALIQRCGMVFAVLVFVVFIFMWLEGVRLFVRKQDRYHKMVGAGFVFMIFDQTLIIICGSTGLCPLTGITLPFISSGGSSLLVTFFMTGVTIAISSNVKWKGTENNEEDEFFKENAVTAKCYAYLCHLNNHIPHPDFRAAAGSIRRGGRTETGSEGGRVREGIRKRKHFRQKGKHSGFVRRTEGRENLQ